MAFRRRKTFRKKRAFRKKFLKKRSSRKGQTAARMFKLRVTATLSSDVGGDISGILSDNPSGANDWVSCGNLFDSYRVCAMKIKYIPSFPNDTNAVAGYAPLYVVYDADHQAQPLASVNDAVQYENLKVMNMYRPWSYYVRIPKFNSISGASAVTIQSGGYIDIGAVTAVSCIAYYGTGFKASLDYGTLVYTFYLKFKNRR